MQKLLIFPFNGNGLEAIDCIEEQYEFIGFIDDTIEKQGITREGFQVFNRVAFSKYKEAKVLAVPGSPTSFRSRKKIIEGLGIPIDRFAKVIHPSAVVSKWSKVGYNSLVMAGVVITSNAIVGNHVCVLPNSVIHHDSSIGDYSLVGSKVLIAGNVNIAENCYIGSGSNIINSVSIGENTLIGLGSNVINNISSNLKAVGNPAKLI
jgi:sugar O-acyltransferase (sialic acid O-acetyltransferase NeuD family)